MITGKASEIVRFLSTEIHGIDAEFHGVSIDSRTVNSSNIFFAIKGKKYDGHNFINDAVNNGASVVIAEKYIETDAQVCFIIVKDTLSALADLAKYYRSQSNHIHTIAITGTNGKTSVTKLTAEILSKTKSIGTTIQNFNNEIGLPLSILNAPSHADVNVYELGASKKNDIKYLMDICNPNMTTLLNISPAHIESFGSFSVLKKTKEEIFEGKNIRTVILNIDDDNYDEWARINKEKKVITVSISNEADYFILSESGKYISIKTPLGTIKLNKTSIHCLLRINIIFSIALSMESGAKIETITDSIENFPGVEGRFYRFKSRFGYDVIDDSYNANPKSMISAIDNVLNYKKNVIFVMGDMGELGEKSRSHHISVIQHAKDRGIRHLFYMGIFKDEAKGIFSENCYTYDDMDNLIRELINIARKEYVILIKASRFMNFDTIAKALR